MHRGNMLACSAYSGPSLCTLCYITQNLLSVVIGVPFDIILLSLHGLLSFLSIIYKFCFYSYLINVRTKDRQETKVFLYGIHTVRDVSEYDVQT